MSRPKQIKRADPKPCPRCYAPMRPTSSGFECARHGSPEPDRAVVAPVPKPRAKRQAPRRVRERRGPFVTGQTQRLQAMQETIVARNQDGESIAAIAADVWQELGYADQHIAASKISRFLNLRGAPVASVRPGPRPGARPETRFTTERLAEVRTAVASGSSVWAFAGSHWQAWGFPSRVACDSLIRKWLRKG